MNIMAAVLAIAFAIPAAAAPVPAKKILAETTDLIVAVVVSGPSGQVAAKSRIQAQSQFSITLDLKGKPHRKLALSGVPVINPNNGKARLEYKARASWGSEDVVEFMSAVELELGAETIVHDLDGVTVRIKITAADN